MLCSNAQQENGGRIMCRVDGKDPHRLCPYQKYCHQKCAWENSPAMTSCERRLRNGRNEQHF